MCGIGTYTKYLTSFMPENRWSVITFQPDEFSNCRGDFEIEGGQRVDRWISLENPALPPQQKGDVLWFQHSFGMWGRVNSHFLKLIEEGKRRGKKVGASFHTIHFQSGETPWGMQDKEMGLLREALPILDFATVFTQGAYRTVAEAFPHYAEKVIVLRHGVHHYPRATKDYARQKFFDYLTQLAPIPPSEKAKLRIIEKSLSWRNTVLLGNYGFITQDKDPLQLYELGRLVQEKLPDHKVITLFVGKIQERKDKKREVCLPILERLKSIHNGKENLFYEDYIPERIFPYAFQALDFALFWCENATQSGRMAHAQGTGVSIGGRKWEGIGETLELSGLPAADTMNELAERISEIVREPGLEERLQEQSRRYADTYSFYNQARKHLILAEAIRDGMKLPALDGEVRNDPDTGKFSPWGFRRFGKSEKGIGINSQRC
jgi:hypothetical protein